MAISSSVAVKTLPVVVCVCVCEFLGTINCALCGMCANNVTQGSHFWCQAKMVVEAVGTRNFSDSV